MDIRRRITDAYASLRPAERAAASYIRDHYDEVGSLSVARIAELAHVSQPTVIRLARKLGFAGYRELRHEVDRSHGRAVPGSGDSSSADGGPYSWDDIDAVPTLVAMAARSALDDLSAPSSLPGFRAAAALLRRASAGAGIVDVYASGRMVAPAVDLYAGLGRAGARCRLAVDGGTQRAFAMRLGGGDVAVAFCGPGESGRADALGALRLAHEGRAGAIAVAASGQPVGRWADARLFVDSHGAPSPCLPYVALADMLCAAVAAGGDGGH